MIVIPVDPDTASLLMEMGYVEVKFSRNQYTSWAAVSQNVDAEGNYYIGLTFTNSMITFSQDRFINIELLLNEVMKERCLFDLDWALCTYNISNYSRIIFYNGTICFRFINTF